MTITNFHSNWTPTARMRWGKADPSVRALNIIPIAKPRPFLNQVAMNLITVGYIPAKAIPVINLERSDKVTPGSKIKNAFAIPATHADIAIMVELL